MNQIRNLQEMLEIDKRTLRSIIAYTFLALEGNKFYGGKFVKSLYDILSARGLSLQSGFVGDNQVFLVAARQETRDSKPETYYLCDVPTLNIRRDGRLEGIKTKFEIIPN